MKKVDAAVLMKAASKVADKKSLKPKQRKAFRTIKKQMKKAGMIDSLVARFLIMSMHSPEMRQFLKEPKLPKVKKDKAPKARPLAKKAA